MGFKGRYSATQGGDLHALVAQLTEQDRRDARAAGRAVAALAPVARRHRHAARPVGSAPRGARRDRSSSLAGGLFAYFTVSLRSGRLTSETETARLSH